MPEVKICTACNRTLALDEFYPAKLGKYGRRSKCKLCEKEYAERNRERIRERNARWARDNRDKVRESARQYNARNKSKIAQYVAANKARIEEYKLQWAHENPDKVRDFKRRWSRSSKGAESRERYMHRHPEKIKARHALNNAIRDGKIERHPCEFCGDEVTEAHHEDYSKPLDVIWVCSRCHRDKFHSRN